MVRAVLSNGLSPSASPAPDRRFPTAFIFCDRRDHWLVAFVTDETVHLAVLSRDDADNRIQHDFIYSTPGLLQDIKGMVELSQDGDIVLEVGDATKLIIRFRKTKADVIELHLGGSDFEGAGLIVPLSRNQF